MKPPWYGGNKIPDSYLRKFQRSVEDEGIPHSLKLFMDQLYTTEPAKESDNASD